MSKILTIGIAAYNVEKYIKKALDSCSFPLYAQDIEVLVLDDGGTDKTAEIADTYAHLYPESVKVIRKENGGYGSNINLAVKIASGKYYRQLDGDDWIEQDSLGKYIELLKRIDADLVLNPNKVVYEQSGSIVLRDNGESYEEGEYELNQLTLLSELNMHSVTYRVDLLRDIDLSITEHCFYTDTEYVFWPLASVKSVYVSHVPVYCYRIGGGEQSMSIHGLRRHYLDHEKVFFKLLNYYTNIENKNGQGAKLLYGRLICECASHYKYLSLLEWSKNPIKLLWEFDRQMKSQMNLRNDAAKYRKYVRALYASGFLIFPLLRVAASWKQNRK